MNRSLLTVAVLFAATHSVAAQLSQPRTERLANGAVRITNTGPSKWAGITGWHWVHVTTVAPAPGSPGELDDIVSLALGDDGSVYVAQRKTPFIKTFGPDGKYRATFGRGGDGPGEFRSAMLGIRGDTLVVQDWAAQRVSFLLTSGKYLRVTQSICCRSQTGFVVDDHGVAWIPGSRRRASEAWARIPVNGKPALEAVAFPSNAIKEKGAKVWEAHAMIGGVESVQRIPVPFVPTDIFAVRPDGNILVGNTGRAIFFVITPAGDTIRRFDAPSTEQKVSLAEREKMVSAWIEHAPEQFQAEFHRVAHASDIPDHQLPWNYFEVDGAGNSWISLAGSSGRGWTVFDPDGRLLGDVASPPIKSSTASTRSKDRIAYLTENVDGEQIVEVFRLVKQGAAPR